MMEAIEYLGTLTRSLISQDLGREKILWCEGETVIVKEIVGIPNFRIVKQKKRLDSMVVKGSEFIYYRPEWVKLR